MKGLLGSMEILKDKQELQQHQLTYRQIERKKKRDKEGESDGQRCHLVHLMFVYKLNIQFYCTLQVGFGECARMMSKTVANTRVKGLCELILTVIRFVVVSRGKV